MNTLNRLASAWLSLGLLMLVSVGVQAGQDCKPTLITPSTPKSDFVFDDSKGVVTNLKTGLMWMRCSLGQIWDGKTCNELASNYSWKDALQQSQAYVFAGYSDWRLPNKNELVSIMEISCVNPTIDLTIFPRTPSAYYWSSTPTAPYLDRSWSVNFYNGYINYDLKYGKLHVRLVRAGL